MLELIKMKRIVILGAGFGGLRTALLLGTLIRKHRLDDRYEIIVVDRNRYHTYTPILYEIATTPQETANHLKLKSITTFDIAQILASRPARFIESEISGIDILAREIRLRDEKMPYDYLVLALGVEPNYYDIPGLREHALTLKTFIDALRIRDQLAIIRSAEENPKIVVGGGGSAGVELAAEVKHWLPRAEVTIVEAGPSILPAFEDRLIACVRRRLECIGINILENTRITKVAESSVLSVRTTARGKETFELPQHLILWTGGNRGSALIDPLRLSKDRAQPLVEPAMNCIPAGVDLSVTSRVYGIGDAVCFYDPRNGKKAPAVARAAISEGSVAAKNIMADILSNEGLSGRRTTYEYRLVKYPYVIPLGGKYAIAKLGPFYFTGFFGWLLKGLIELFYLFSIMPNWLAMKIWLRGLKIFFTSKRVG